jgi:hypothetical protein
VTEPDPPTVRGISLRRSWPFIAVVERTETRAEHRTWALFMTFVAVTGVVLSGLPTVVGVLAAFIAGYASANWVLYPHAYGEGSA